VAAVPRGSIRRERPVSDGGGVHGGPASRRPLAAGYRAPFAGLLRLLPQPRGSYGRRGIHRATKDFGGGDLRDILAGVDVALGTAPVDPNRIGITGWSYGGFMTMFAVTQTTRFKAAVPAPALPTGRVTTART
jgi:dipeptidyl aminopeptidase/acylaminoacyl peptidase